MLRAFAWIPVVALNAQVSLADGHLIGDVAVGEQLFAAHCKGCHSIVTDDGETVVKGGTGGPNLYGVMGRTAGTAGFNGYGADLVAAGSWGLVWDQANTAEYLVDPQRFVRTFLDKPNARSAKQFKMRAGSADVAAYLFAIAPAEN